MYHASQKNRKITSLRKKAEIKIQINDNYAVFVGWFVFFSLSLSLGRVSFYAKYYSRVKPWKENYKKT